VIFLQVPQKYSVYTAVKKLLIRMGRWPYGGWETEFSEKELVELAVRAGFAPQYSYGMVFRIGCSSTCRLSNFGLCGHVESRTEVAVAALP